MKSRKQNNGHHFSDRSTGKLSRSLGRLPPSYIASPARQGQMLPAQQGSAFILTILSTPRISRAAVLNFDDIVPQAAPAQSSGRLNFDDIVPNNQSALPPGFVLDHPQGGNVFDQFDPPQGTASDIAKSGGIGVLKGVIGLAGLPGDAWQHRRSRHRCRYALYPAQAWASRICGL